MDACYHRITVSFPRAFRKVSFTALDDDRIEKILQLLQTRPLFEPERLSPPKSLMILKLYITFSPHIATTNFAICIPDPSFCDR